jgi:hypothetical protein
MGHSSQRHLEESLERLEITIGKFFQLQIFIAGLHKPIRMEIMKCTHANFQAIYEDTLDLEIIQHDNKATKTVMVVAVEVGKILHPTTCRPSLPNPPMAERLSAPLDPKEDKADQECNSNIEKSLAIYRKIASRGRRAEPPW